MARGQMLSPARGRQEVLLSSRAWPATSWGQRRRPESQAWPSPATELRQHPSSVPWVLPDNNRPSEQAGREKPPHKGGDLEDTHIRSHSTHHQAPLPSCSSLWPHLRSSGGWFKSSFKKKRNPYLVAPWLMLPSLQFPACNLDGTERYKHLCLKSPLRSRQQQIPGRAAIRGATLPALPAPRSGGAAGHGWGARRLAERPGRRGGGPFGSLHHGCVCSLQPGT